MEKTEDQISRKITELKDLLSQQEKYQVEELLGKGKKEKSIVFKKKKPKKFKTKILSQQKPFYINSIMLFLNGRKKIKINLKQNSLNFLAFLKNTPNILILMHQTLKLSSKNF